MGQSSLEWPCLEKIPSFSLRPNDLSIQDNGFLARHLHIVGLCHCSWHLALRRLDDIFDPKAIGSESLLLLAVGLHGLLWLVAGDHCACLCARQLRTSLGGLLLDLLVGDGLGNGVF